MTFSTRKPGAPLGTMIALRPSLPPFVLFVLTMHTLTLAPCLSHPPALHGQYLRPFSTYSPFINSAVRPMPTGDGCGASKFAVPPGRPPAPPTPPTGKILSLRVRAGRPKPLLLFGIGAEPGDVHEAQTIDQERRREARVDGANLLGDQLEVEGADAAATVLLGKESHGDPKLIRLDISRLGLGEGLMRVARCICIGNQRSEHVLREVTRGLPQILLFCRQPEIDGHCCSSLKRWSAGSAQVPRRPKLLLPVCFRAPQLLWCAPISDGQLAIAAQSLAGLR